jgi:hypothetical protein
MKTLKIFLLFGVAAVIYAPSVVQISGAVVK